MEDYCFNILMKPVS